MRKTWRQRFISWITRRGNGRGHEIAPDEIFLDASNLPLLDPEQFEGRVETPVSSVAIVSLGIVFVIASGIFIVRAFDLQVLRGGVFAEASQNNRLEHSITFAGRGVIYDRHGRELAWNESSADPYDDRRYRDASGLSHVIGYVHYPRIDEHGNWWREEITGVTGAERQFDDVLSGQNGKKLVEVDARGEVHREQIIEPAVDGEHVTLSIDAEVQSQLHEALSAHAARQGFEGGASVILDIDTGEVIALVSTPEFDSQAVTDGDSEALKRYNTDVLNPFLNRAVAGLYTPGSIVKPIFAAAALAEGIIDPEKEIFSPGHITIPNPFNPDNPTIMRDWRAHGWTDMREALAVSSDVYFYTIGGGYEDQAGLGIDRLDAYAKRFGLSRETGIELGNEASGLVPTPAWKARTFDGDLWRVGDTYNTSIGQYGFQVTPVQAARYAAAIANGGFLLTPTVVRGDESERTPVGIADADLQIVREGMRMAVTSPDGTVQSLNISGFPLAAKSGTAEVGSEKQWINSWVIGFWPVNDPQYAFATVLERAPSGTISGAAPAMRPFFEWFRTYEPETEHGTSSPEVSSR